MYISLVIFLIVTFQPTFTVLAHKVWRGQTGFASLSPAITLGFYDLQRLKGVDSANKHPPSFRVLTAVVLLKSKPLSSSNAFWSGDSHSVFIQYWAWATKHGF